MNTQVSLGFDFPKIASWLKAREIFNDYKENLKNILKDFSASEKKVFIKEFQKQLGELY